MLTYQEKRVLISLACGFSLAMIAEKEGIRLEYLKSNIIASLYRKLGAKNAAQAVAQGFVKSIILDEVPKTEPRTSLKNLTEKEIRVCLAARDGVPSRVIAAQLGMSDASVRRLLQSARNKTGLTNEQLASALTLRQLGRVS
jgi:DNA-binding NarL/FixJ family response regulator